jgi:putative ABC transport system permease protein
MGLYNVMSYTVSQRVAEIGIRMTMGARPRNVITMVVGQGMALALTGMAVGTVAAFATTRLVASMLFRVDAADPATFVLAGLFLGAVTLVATWVPAFRATRIDRCRR